MDYKIFNNIGGERDMTDEEITAFNNGKRNASEKLEDISNIIFLAENNESLKHVIITSLAEGDDKQKINLKILLKR